VLRHFTLDPIWRKLCRWLEQHPRPARGEYPSDAFKGPNSLYFFVESLASAANGRGRHLADAAELCTTDVVQKDSAAWGRRW